MGNELSSEKKDASSAYALDTPPIPPKHAHYPLHYMSCVSVTSFDRESLLLNAPFYKVEATAYNENDVRATINKELQRVASSAGSVYGPVFALVMRNLDEPRGDRMFKSAIDLILYFPCISQNGKRLTSYDALGRTHRWIMRLFLSPQYTFSKEGSAKLCLSKCLYNSRGIDPGNPDVPVIGTVRASAQFKRYNMTDFSYVSILGIVPDVKKWDYYPEDYFPCGSHQTDATLRIAEYAPEREYFYAFHQINPRGVSGVSWEDQRMYFNILPQNFPLYSGARWAMRSRNGNWICVLEHFRLVIYGNAQNYFDLVQAMEMMKYSHVDNKECNRTRKKDAFCYATALLFESNFYTASKRAYKTKWQLPSPNRDFMNQLMLEPGLLQLTAENETSNEIVLWKVRFSTAGFAPPFALVLTDDGDLIIYDGNNKEVLNALNPRPAPDGTDTAPEDTDTLLRSSSVRRSDVAPSSLAYASTAQVHGTSAQLTTSGTTTAASQASSGDGGPSRVSGADAQKCPLPPFKVL